MGAGARRHGSGNKSDLDANGENRWDEAVTIDVLALRLELGRVTPGDRRFGQQLVVVRDGRLMAAIRRSEGYRVAAGVGSPPIRLRALARESGPLRARGPTHGRVHRSVQVMESRSSFARLPADAPPLSVIEDITRRRGGTAGRVIRIPDRGERRSRSPARSPIPPDTAVCEDCLGNCATPTTVGSATRSSRVHELRSGGTRW